jgi:hypothetical protein
MVKENITESKTTERNVPEEKEERKEGKMDSYRKTAIIVGVLFIIATVASVASFFFYQSIYEPDYLNAVSANEIQLLFGVLLMLVAIIAIVGIPIMMFPMLKKHNESLALGYVGARMFEALFFIFNIVVLLSILSLSHEFVGATAPDGAYFQTSGALLKAEYDWNSILLDIPFAISALIFYYLLYQLKLVPRWLSGWGLIGGILWLPGAVLVMLGLPEVTFLAAPLGMQEMVFAIWLIVKGFDSSAIASRKKDEVITVE